MKWTIPIALLCGDVGLRRAASPQSPQTSDCRYVLSLNLALATASEAIRLRVEDGYRVTATVVGMAAAPQVALRGDGATVNTRESSFQKTFTVVTLGPMFNFDTSGEFFNLVKANPYAPRLATVSDVMALPGAVAFKSKKAIVAARGVGGVRGGGDKDEVCAQAGVAKAPPGFHLNVVKVGASTPLLVRKRRDDALCYWAPNDEPRFTRRHRLRFFAARNVARGGHVVAVLRSQLATGAGAS